MWQKSDRRLSDLHMKRCPFKSSHVVCISRFEAHLKKCFDSLSPDERNTWSVCPYSADHYIKNDNYNQHILSCPMSLRDVRTLFESLDTIDEEADETSIATTSVPNYTSIKDRKVTYHSFGIPDLYHLNEVEADFWEKKVEPRKTCMDYKVTEAEDLLSDEYQKDSHSFIDTIHIQRLNKSERTRLNRIMVNKIKSSWTDAKLESRDQLRTGQTLVLSSNNKLMTSEWQVPYNMRSLVDKLHSVDIPIDYKQVLTIKPEPKPDIQLIQCLHSVDWAPEGKPLRKPRTLSFFGKYK